MRREGGARADPGREGRRWALCRAALGGGCCTRGMESLRERPGDLGREIGHQRDPILGARGRAPSRQAAKKGQARSKQAGVFWRTGARDGKAGVCAV